MLRFEHILDFFGNLEFQFFHDFYSFFDAHSVPCFKGTKLMIVTPFHGVIDADDCVADFRNAIGGIDKIPTKVFARDFRSHIRAVEQYFEFIGKAACRLFRCIYGFKVWFGRDNIFHRLVIENQF